MAERGKGIGNKLRLNSTPRVTAPDEMTEAGKKIWESIVSVCPANQFAKSDIPILQVYCEAVVSIGKAQKKLEEVEWVYTCPVTGLEKKSEWLMILKNQQSTVAMLATKLGLCPSSRVDRPKKMGNNHSPPSESKRADLLAT